MNVEPNPREWPSGTRVQDMAGRTALLLRPPWGQFAWIIYDGSGNPSSVLTSTLKPIGTVSQPNELSLEELTDRFYIVKEQRDRFLAFCKAVCPTSSGTSYSIWDHQVGIAFKELMVKDRERLTSLLVRLAPLNANGVLDKAHSACRRAGEHQLAEELTSLGNDIRAALAKQKPIPHPSRILEALKAIADHEHCLTKYTVQGLRDIAQAALEEFDPRYDYSAVHQDR